MDISVNQLFFSWPHSGGEILNSKVALPINFSSGHDSKREAFTDTIDSHEKNKEAVTTEELMS